MALAFTKVRSTKLAPTDKITHGKLSGCRVCDVVADHYEYLIWAHKTGLLQYTQEVLDSILATAGFEAAKEHFHNEVEPWLDNDTDIPY